MTAPANAPYELIELSEILTVILDLPGRESLTVDEAKKLLADNPPATINLAGVDYVVYSMATGELLSYVPDELSVN